LRLKLHSSSTPTFLHWMIGVQIGSHTHFHSHTFI
jgi:hypothetical protein